MCGIVGLWNLNGEPISPDELNHFINSLAHRGPDGSDIYIDAVSHLGFGHRRLAIIDTSDGGRQPMSYADGRYWIVFNGEMYNFLELKTELEALGYSFKTESDTEVILTAFHHWGEDCQLKFNGMWALAIWDSKERKLFVSRDRFGVKPMIYHYDENHFAFASEMKAFLALDWFEAEFDPAMVALALTNERLIEGDERCMLKGLNHLLGGHCLTLRQGEALKIRRWWNTLDHLESVPQNYDDQVARFRELFLDACRIRMRSDVPIGTALSGGLDSSSILCGMTYIRNTTNASDRLAHEWQKAFIMTYPGAVIDERKYADEVIKKTGVTPIYCTGNSNLYLDHFDDILFQYEEISDIHLGPWLVHKFQRENNVVVTIDGHGGDELLGGYPWHVTAALKDSISSLSPRRARDVISIMKGLELFPQNQFYLKSAQTLFTKMTKENDQPWLTYPIANFTSSAYEHDMPLIKDRDALFRSLYVDFHFTQLPMNLRDFDRLSMAHGVEVRSPFMDWRLVCYSFSLPSTVKVGRGFTKRILRDALKGILPESIRTRTRKLGFPNLAEAWTSPRAQEFIQDVVRSVDFQQSEIWNGKKVAEDLSLAIRNQDNDQLHQAWIYAQAARLMQLFNEKRRVYA
ncbi:MAG TPA: asparagine synthase (glutamine-hydrolyzing) [Anaerolineales bacterium]|nr:asparagine synthase (glutamine-hydrolyzing) [Anaerolineales bacterium]